MFLTLSPVSVLLAIAALATVGDPKEALPDQSIPLTVTERGHYLVEARINGAGPYRFLIDTGATMSLVTEPVAQELGLVTGGRTVLVHGVTRSQDLATYTIKTLRIGAHVETDLTVLAAPIIGEARIVADGILGADIMDAFAIDIDLGARTVSLIEGDVPLVGVAGVTRARFTRTADGLPIVQARLNGRFTSALIDTGLNTSIVSTRFARYARADQLPLNGSLKGVTGSADTLTRAAVGRLKIEGLNWQGAALAVYDTPVFDQIAVEPSPEMIIGADLLNGHRVIIDYRANEVILVRKRRTGASPQYARS